MNRTSQGFRFREHVDQESYKKQKDLRVCGTIRNAETGRFSFLSSLFDPTVFAALFCIPSRLLLHPPHPFLSFRVQKIKTNKRTSGTRALSAEKPGNQPQFFSLVLWLPRKRQLLPYENPYLSKGENGGSVFVKKKKKLTGEATSGLN